MIDLTVDRHGLDAAVQRCRERGVVIPTFAEMRDPTMIASRYREELSTIGLWEVHPRNLFRVTWKNQPVEHGGGFGSVNYIELPTELTGTRARVVALVGKWFPTGAHKVGATFGCIVPPLVSGRFNPETQRAVWPSTGNFCRGGAYIAALLGCESIAILPEGMSRERFEWLKTVAGEVISTPGSESNVKEIFDACWRLRDTRNDIVIFNQFEELGNHLWHYEVTGHAAEEVLAAVMGPQDRYAGIVLASGSAGTLGCGDYLKQRFPTSKIAVGEALQCPTLFENGFGAHRIEGIGDKHVPWIHNVRNTDMVIAVDDEIVMRTMRLFNEDVGRSRLHELGVPASVTAKLDLLGISGIGNLLGAIEFARYYELDSNDIVLTVLTDSMELYGSRIAELRTERGVYSQSDAWRDWERMRATGGALVQELRHTDRRRIHNLKYYTWIEQQGRELEELNRQWYDFHSYWSCAGLADHVDDRIRAFNAQVRTI